MAFSFESVSTWKQPAPARQSGARVRLIDRLAHVIADLSAGRLRVAIDGHTGAGKTTFGHELAAALRHRGRPTAQASLDDFKHPWRHASEQGYDRVTGAGYYRNAYDFDAARNLLLIPSGPNGSGHVALCAHDPLTGEDHRSTLVELPSDTVLIVDSVFALRLEYNDLWDYRIWLEVDREVTVRRGIERDSGREGIDAATEVHRGRYYLAESIYLAEVNPRAIADTVIDNSDFSAPRVLRLGRSDRDTNNESD